MSWKHFVSAKQCLEDWIAAARRQQQQQQQQHPTMPTFAFADGCQCGWGTPSPQRRRPVSTAHEGRPPAPAEM